MINLRYVGNRFFLGGRWENLYEDLNQLNLEGIRAILDLQFIPGDESLTPYIMDKCRDINIEYDTIYFQDIEYYSETQLDAILEQGFNHLSKYEETYPSRKDRFLIKSGTGISRAPTMLIYYLCTKNRTPYEDELFNILDAELGQNDTHLQASPNMGFQNYLSLRFK